jgi:signal transduction histidine kinase
MSNRADVFDLGQSAVVHIQEILVLKGAIVQRAHDRQIDRWMTIAQSPDKAANLFSEVERGGNLSNHKLQEVEDRLQQREIVEFTAVTTLMNISICNRYVFVPIIDRDRLWGRICLLGEKDTIWTPQDLAWVQALGQQLLLLAGVQEQTPQPIDNILPTPPTPLTAMVDLIDRIADLEGQLENKDEFINRISHDLRAPLMNIKMAGKMVQLSIDSDPLQLTSESGARTQKYLRMLEQECDRQLVLIERILDLQHLDLSMSEIDLEEIDLQSWLKSAIEGFTDRAIERRQFLNSFCEEELPRLESDLYILGKIGTELLNNACKYTDRGGEIAIQIDRSPTYPDRVTISVSNQATISAEHLDQIFDRFYRIPGADKYQQGGNGLGLSLVRKLVHRLGGTITVTSDRGWTVFKVELPYRYGTKTTNDVARAQEVA